MLKAGILGGGQLGRMLLQAAANYPVLTFVMENDPDCPSAHLCHHFQQGDITSYDDVISFGRMVDVLTIEIENVNVEALEKLESEGKRIIPRPSALRTIKNKIYQKQFYSSNNIPTSEFVITSSKNDVSMNPGFLPGVHKLATGGYDGRGVQILEDEDSLQHAFDAPAVLEKKIDLEKEIAMMVAVFEDGKTVLYPPVDMVFDHSLNLLNHQVCPAELPEKTLWKAEAIALAVVRALKSPGIFAVELFTDKEGNVLVNETAPRVHNSGHHTIEACYSSQFDMLWRIMLEYPAGNTKSMMSSSLVNLIGEEGYTGPAVYDGLDKVLAMDNVFVHIYGKANTKPGRKMGHVTILSNEKQDLLYKANLIRKTLFVKS